jgi:hypothetical protein
MKKIEAITPPPTFSPDTPIGDSLNTAFSFENFEENADALIISTKEVNSPGARRRERKRRQSPETKWLIPEQHAEIKEKMYQHFEPRGQNITESDGPVKPPTSQLTDQPYQVQLVRKETLKSKVNYPATRNRAPRVEMDQMTPKNTPSPLELNRVVERRLSYEQIDFQSKYRDDVESMRDEGSKKSTRKHKRDQEKQLLKIQNELIAQDQKPTRQKSKTRKHSIDGEEHILRYNKFMKNV